METLVDKYKEEVGAAQAERLDAVGAADAARAAAAACQEADHGLREHVAALQVRVAGPPGNNLLASNQGT